MKTIIKIITILTITSIYPKTVVAKNINGNKTDKQGQNGKWVEVTVTEESLNKSTQQKKTRKTTDADIVAYYMAEVTDPKIIKDVNERMEAAKTYLKKGDQANAILTFIGAKKTALDAFRVTQWLKAWGANKKRSVVRRHFNSFLGLKRDCILTFPQAFSIYTKNDEARATMNADIGIGIPGGAR